MVLDRRNMTTDPMTLAALEKLIAAIRACADARRATDEWRQAYRLLQKTELPADRLTEVVGMRDADALAELLDELRRPAVAGALPDVPAKEICAKALQAFRKRFSLTVLDEESKLGRNPMTKGAKSGISGIAPPKEWPQAVWEELVRQGELRYVGHGLYAPTRPQ